MLKILKILKILKKCLGLKPKTQSDIKDNGKEDKRDKGTKMLL